MEQKSRIKDWNKKFICCISRPFKKQKANCSMGKDTAHMTFGTWGDQNQGRRLVLKHTLERSLKPGLNLDRGSYMVLSNDLWRNTPWWCHQKHAPFSTPFFGEFKATLAKCLRTISCILLENWLRQSPILIPALISEGTAENSEIRQEDKGSNTTFLWFLFHSTSIEENSAEVWEEWLDGANFWEGFQWNLSTLLPLLSQVKSLSVKWFWVLHSSGRKAEVHELTSYLQGGCGGFNHW